MAALPVALNSRLGAETRVKSRGRSCLVMWRSRNRRFTRWSWGGFGVVRLQYDAFGEPAAEEIAAALSEALENSELKATVSGKLSLAPIELKLAIAAARVPILRRPLLASAAKADGRTEQRGEHRIRLERQSS
jgi:hypothetical protein